MTGSKRRGLSDFLGKELRSVAPPPPTTPAREKERGAKSVTSRVPAKGPARRATPEAEPGVTESVSSGASQEVTDSQSSGVTDSQSSGVTELPPYLRLTRKEVRFREEQLEALDRVVRRLVRARRGGGERITDNTLVRVAVDLLLERADELAGATEAELLRALRQK